MENSTHSPDDGSTPTPRPDPCADWIDQGELAALLGISAKTASLRACRGELKQYEHCVPGCGRRKYSRALYDHVLETCYATSRNESQPEERPEAGHFGR